MTTKDALAALERLEHFHLCISQSITRDSSVICAADLATLRAFVTEMGPVREVLERKGSSIRSWRWGHGDICSDVFIDKKHMGSGPTYTAACTAALEAVDGDKEMS